MCALLSLLRNFELTARLGAAAQATLIALLFALGVAISCAGCLWSRRLLKQSALRMCSTLEAANAELDRLESGCLGGARCQWRMYVDKPNIRELLLLACEPA